MSTLSLTSTQIADLLVENYGTMVVDNVFRKGTGNRLNDDSIYGRLAARGCIEMDGADASDRYASEWAVHISSATATSFDASDAFPAATPEGYDDASIGWKRNGISLEFDNLFINLKNITRRQLSAIGNEFVQKQKALVDALSTQLIGDGTGNSSKDIDGFKSFLKTTGSYAGIPQTNSYWQPQIDTTGGALAKSHFETILIPLHNDTNGIGTGFEIWMNYVQWLKYKALYSDSIRYVPGQAPGEIVPMWNDGQLSVPIYIINDVPTTEVWFVNLDEIKLRFKTNSPAPEMADQADGTLSYQNIPIHVEPVYKDKDVKGLFLKFYSNLICRNPVCFGASTGLST